MIRRRESQHYYYMLVIGEELSKDDGKDEK